MRGPEPAEGAEKTIKSWKVEPTELVEDLKPELTSEKLWKVCRRSRTSFGMSGCKVQESMFR